MKKSGLLALITTAVIFSSSVFAADQPSKNLFTKMVPSAADTTAKSLLHPPTNITVVNASSSYIYVTIPGTAVNDYLRPGINDHIYSNDPNVFYWYLLLKDTYNRAIYSGQVCREAIVVVTGYTGNFTFNTDSDLCN
jgi:hypothetical protein